MTEVERKKWNMKPKTRVIVSTAYKLSQEMNEVYNQRVTVRQIFYHLFSRGVVENNPRGYNSVGYAMTQARKRGYIPFEWIEDRSRKSLYSLMYDDLSEFLRFIIQQYKRNTWLNQKYFVIVLVEKESLSNII